MTRDQARDLLACPDLSTLEGKRDRAILAVLIGCALRRSELAVLAVENLVQRDASGSGQVYIASSQGAEKLQPENAAIYRGTNGPGENRGLLKVR